MRALAAGLALVATLTAIATFVVATAPSALAQKKCEARGTATKPVISGKLELDTASGPLVFQIGSAAKCGGNYHYGLVDGRGKVAVPAQYRAAVPATTTFAVVETYDGKAFFYPYGKSAKPAPFNKVARVCENGIYGCIYGGYLEKPGGLNDYWLYPQGAEPALRITDVERVERADEVILAHYRAPDGTELSRVFDVNGQPLSPAVRRITAFNYVPAMREYDFRGGRWGHGDMPQNLMTVIADLDDPSLTEKRVYLPLDAKGAPLALPPGAVGVIRLPPQPGVFEDVSFGWGVALPGPDGLEFAVTFGTLEQSLAQAATAPRISGLVWHETPRGNGGRDADYFFTIRDRNGWRVGLADRFQVPSDHIYDSVYPTMEAARDAYHAALNVKEANILAARERYEREWAAQRAAWDAERARAQQERRAQTASKWAAVKAADTLCEQGENDVADYPVEAVNEYLRTCEVKSGFLFARTDADAAALNLGKQRHNRYVETARQEQQAKFGVGPLAQSSGSGGDPWAAGLAAAMASQQASMDAFWARQAATYQQNFNAWNSGAQNWCCGTSKPN